MLDLFLFCRIPLLPLTIRTLFEFCWFYWFLSRSFVGKNISQGFKMSLPFIRHIAWKNDLNSLIYTFLIRKKDEVNTYFLLDRVIRSKDWGNPYKAHTNCLTESSYNLGSNYGLFQWKLHSYQRMFVFKKLDCFKRLLF